MQKLGLVFVLASLTLMAACGGGGSGSSTITSVTVTCSPSTILYGQTSQCSATVMGTGSFSSGVTWAASAGTISASGLFTAPSGGVTSLQVTITATSTQDTSKSGTATVTVNPTAAGANVQPITVDAGPPQLTQPSTNVAFTTVTVCVPGTTTCQSIDHVMVDTGSSGLRLISGVLSIALPPGTDPNNNNDAFDECLVFLDGYIWGPVATADVTMSGETASSVPVQVIIPSSSSPAVPSSCSVQNPAGGAGNEGGSSNSNSVATFGANGIIGVGLFQQDCGGYCVSQGSTCNSSNNNPCVYYDCPPSGCSPANIALAEQIPNPVTAFTSTGDDNGVIIELPSVPNGGSSPVGGPYLTGSLIFGINTQSNNQLNGTQVYDVPDSGPDAGGLTTIFNGNTYTSSFIDSGSNGFFFNDSSISTCPSPNQYWFCPTTSPLSLSAQNQGTNMSSPVSVSFSIENADNLFNTPNTAFSTLAGPYGSTPPVEFDWGLSFFYGRHVFTAIDNTNTPGVGSGPYFAY